MATTTLTAATLIFVSLWLMALLSFALVASGLLLYVLGAVDSTIGPSVAASLLCSTFSLIYLIFQCINTSNAKNRRSCQSWISSACVQLPRILILAWIITTTIGLVIALRQPLCRSGDIKKDAAAWQAGLGCWIFRGLVSLSAVMLILSFSLFCLLEVNGRYVSISLFHFEYIRSSHRRRRTLIEIAHGESTEDLSAMALKSEDRLQLMEEKRDACPARSLSPSPTYHTFDSSATSLWPGSYTNGSSLSEPPIPFDLTLHGSLPSRRSTSLTASTLPSAIFSSSQLQSRPVTKIPALPSLFQGNVPEVSMSDNSLGFRDIQSTKNAISCLPLHNAPVSINSPQVLTSCFKSTCALPLEPATCTHSIAELFSTSSTRDLASHKHKPSQISLYAGSHHVSRLSTASLPGHAPPPPAWCPQSLKSAPLSADPAIRRLTELHYRSRSSVAKSNRHPRKSGSLGAFEFGFKSPGAGNSQNTRKTGRCIPLATSGAGNGSKCPRYDPEGEYVGDVDTPCPSPGLNNASRRSIGVNFEKRSSEFDRTLKGFGKENQASITAVSETRTTKSHEVAAPAILTAGGHTNTAIASTELKKDTTMNRTRARARSGTARPKRSGSKGQFSIMPPTATRVSGLGIEGVGSLGARPKTGTSTSGSTDRAVGEVTGFREKGVDTDKTASTSASRSMSMSKGKGKAKEKEKRIVERGRYEVLPR